MAIGAINAAMSGITNAAAVTSTPKVASTEGSKDSFGDMVANALNGVANAQAKTAICGITQGFVQQEDVAMKQVCEDYMKASGNKLEYSIMPHSWH